jgi:hypothetical protein
LYDRRDLAGELSDGILYWIDAAPLPEDGRLRSAEYTYQRCIPELMPLVHEETADRLFGHFSLLDLETYQNPDDTSGYNPLIDLLRNPDIPQKYIDSAVAQWIDIAELEERHQRWPRQEYERAVIWMQRFVQSWTRGMEVNRSAHTQIIRFLEDHLPVEQHYVRGDNVGRVAGSISDVELRFWFLTRHSDSESEQLGSFTVNDELDLAILEWAKLEAQKRGVQATGTRLAAIEQAYKNRRRATEARKAGELALIDRLRQP